MANVGDVRDRGDLFRDRLLEGSIPSQLRYFAEITVGSPTANLEVFINGEEGSRFYLPDNCSMSGSVIVTAWEVGQTVTTDQLAGELTFTAHRINGVTTISSTTVSTTNGISQMQVDSGVNAIGLYYQPPLNTTTIVTAVMNYSFAALNLRPSNFYRVSG